MRMLSTTSSMDDFFDNFFVPSTRFENKWSPSCDIEETKDHFLLSFDMPGLREKDINLEIKDNTLTVSGKRNREWKSEEKEGFVRTEKSYGSFQRSFSLPQNVNTKKVEAHFENGVLNVAIPKAEVSTGHKVEIQTGKEGFFSKLLGEKNTKDVTAS